MRRWVALVVGAVVLLPLLAPVAPAAAVARAVVGSACDASGDGVAGGVVEEVVSSGADGAAGDLAADAGVVLSPARAAHRWRVPVCVEVVDDGDPATEDRRVLALGPAVEELRPEAAGWERSALDKTLGSLRPQFVRPGAWTSPHVAGVQVVGLEMWLAVNPDSGASGTWRSFSATARAGEVEVTATATPRRTVWEFSDGVVEVCEGPGVQWSPGAGGPAPCGRDFSRTTAGQPPMVLEVRIEYEVLWSSTIGGSATVVERGEPNRYELVVGEVQTYLTDGSREAPPEVGPLPLPESSQPVNDSDCGWSKPWECSPADIVDAATDFATDVAWNALPQPVKDALTQVWSFLEGCAAFVGDVLGSVQEVLAQMGQLISDTQGFIDEKLQLARSLLAGVREDPGAFATEMLGGMVDRELFNEDKAKWAGKIGCELAVGILTGGAAAAGGRFASLFSDVNRFMRRIDDWLTRRRNGNGNDGDGGGPPGTCSTSSFPTGTEVLLADGARRAIELVRPGDVVLAFDADDGTWAPRAVLHQWSYLDTDEMATLRLTDGSTVTATDHHRFWSSSSRTFREAQQLSPGERLATPTGTVALAEVTVRASGPTLVWELTVAGLHTFAVLTGPHPLAVHNRCDPPPSPDNIDDALRDANLDGISAAEVEGAWSRYEGTLSADQWLDRYINVRRNAGVGGVYETETLTRLGVPKNTLSYPPGGDPDFIPDAVLGDNPPRFVEIKNYENTTLYRGSNAARQVEYLERWARTNPDGGRPTFDLWISDESNISDTFADLLSRSSPQVDITVNGQPWLP